MADEPSARTASEDRLEYAVDVLSKKWTVTIVRLLLEEGPIGFSALERSLDGISGKVLSECLDRLQTEDVIDRRVIQERPLRVEYALTAKGADLEPVVASLSRWSETHVGSEPPTVLLVDDDVRLVEMHASWLEEFRVRTATDGTNALEELDDDVDILVTDRRMPERSGEDLARYVKTRDIDCGVVFLSSVDVNEPLLEVPFDAYVQKPTMPDQLCAVVDDVLAAGELDGRRRELESIRSRLTLFEADLPEETRRTSDHYQALLARAFELEETLEVEAEKRVSAAGGS